MSNQCRIDVESMPNRPLRWEGEADSREKCVGDFCSINFGGFCRGFSWRIFLEDFSGHFFPTKMRKKNQAIKSAKKSGG